jgi:hypothetical protein
MHTTAMNLQNLWIMDGPLCGPSAVPAAATDPLPDRPTHRYARNNIRNILSLNRHYFD